MRWFTRTMVFLASIGVAACQSADSASSSSPTADPPTSADFARALADGSPFTLEFERWGGRLGTHRALTIAADGTCEGSIRERGSDRPTRRSGRLGAADRATILEALRDAPFHELDFTTAASVMDGDPVRIAVSIGGRRREVERQMFELDAARLGPLCSTLDALLASLEPR